MRQCTRRINRRWPKLSLETGCSLSSSRHPFLWWLAASRVGHFNLDEGITQLPKLGVGLASEGWTNPATTRGVRLDDALRLAAAGG